MANADIPNGLRPYGTLTGAPYNGQMMKMFSDADNLFLGDIVIKNAAGTASGDGAYTACDRATSATATVALGVVVGWEANPTALDNMYHVASTTYAVYVCVDPNVIYKAQGDGAGTVATAADVGLNYDIVIGAGDTTSGISNMEVDSSSGATTIDTPLKLVGMVDEPSNEVGVANQKMLVTLNMSVFGAEGGRTGI